LRPTPFVMGEGLGEKTPIMPVVPRRLPAKQATPGLPKHQGGANTSLLAFFAACATMLSMFLVVRFVPPSLPLSLSLGPKHATPLLFRRAGVFLQIARGPCFADPKSNRLASLAYQYHVRMPCGDIVPRVHDGLRCCSVIDVHPTRRAVTPRRPFSLLPDARALSLARYKGSLAVCFILPSLRGMQHSSSRNADTPPPQTTPVTHAPPHVTFETHR